MHVKEKIHNQISKLLSLTHSYQKSFLILYACQIKLFTHLHNKALSLDHLTLLCEITNIDTFRLFLDACCEIGLITKSSNLYKNTFTTNELLSEKSPYYIGDIILMSLDYSKYWHNLISNFEKGDSCKYQTIVKNLSEDEVSRYVNGMNSLSKLLGHDILNLVDFTEKKQLLDIGGGSGGYSILFANKYEKLNINILELEPIAKYTEKYILENKLSDRVKVVIGDIFIDNIPSNNDVVFISNIIHWYNSEDNMLMLSKVYDSMSNGGIIIIHDFMDEVQYMGFALFSFSRNLVTHQARAYHYDEVYNYLSKLRFNDINITTLNNFAKTTLITARK